MSRALTTGRRIAETRRMLETGLSLLVLAVIALVAGAVYLWRRGDRASRRKAGLMLVLAAVMAANVAIWTIPDGAGSTPLGQNAPR